ncbi:uncharacterized protein BDW70DRAFT_789 [Aspergillus foveolatus]|uniref:uncharacterized protein n=1 Tax=Aspergillus foveolatus TaxID=210207 RepID=UPI003CCD3D4B
MAPQQSWASLVLGLTISISPLTTAFPIRIPAENAICPETAREIQARSAIPDPRMIPSETDLMAAILAGLGMQELEKFNKLHTDKDGQDSGATMVIDDSHAPTPTVTELDNHVDNGKEKGEDTAKDDANAAEDREGFVDTLFEVLKKKFREAINGSDEIGLV